MPQTDLIAQALATFGTFYRATLSSDEEPSFGAMRLSDNDVSASSSVRFEDMTFTVTVRPSFGATARERDQEAHPVDVYLDGMLVESTQWRLASESWRTEVGLSPEAELEVNIVGRCATPPSVLQLVRDRPVS